VVSAAVTTLIAGVVSRLRADPTDPEPDHGDTGNSPLRRYRDYDPEGD
jgi:hypothetical protein